MKCEPSAYTIDNLKRDGSTSWEGVRNYQARNMMRDDMKEGDPVLFYASNADPSGVTGLAKISRGGYPDPFALKNGKAAADAARLRATPRRDSGRTTLVRRPGQKAAGLHYGVDCLFAARPSLTTMSYSAGVTG